MTPLRRIIARTQGLAMDLNRLDAEKDSFSAKHVAWALRKLCDDVTTIGALMLEEADRVEKVDKIDGPSHPA